MTHPTLTQTNPDTDPKPDPNASASANPNPALEPGAPPVVRWVPLQPHGHSVLRVELQLEAASTPESAGSGTSSR